MPFGNRAAPVAAAAVLALAGATLVGVTTTRSDATATSNQVRVGTFNVSGVNNDPIASGDQHTWRERRPVVVKEILGAQLDVVGLQEANQSSIYSSSLDYGKNQYLDLKAALNNAGGHYALTNEYYYNCVKDTSNQNCVYQYRGASGDNRIIYNTDTVSLVSQGSMLYKAQTTGKNPRWLVWAKLKMKATGTDFLFTNTHLDPYSLNVRKAQWGQLITAVNSLKGTLPVISVGDLSTSKFASAAATYLPRMKSSGYGDLLDQRYASYAAAPRAKSVRNAWINSYNGFRSDVRLYSRPDRSQIANNVDWIFATNSLKAKSWETVADYDPTTMVLNGVIPAKHNLLAATLVVP